MTARAPSAVLLVALATGVLHADSAPDCSRVVMDVPLDHEVASSGVWSNLFRRPDSVRVESARLLADARRSAAVARPPADLCPAYCAADSTPRIVLRTTPTAFLDDYEEYGKCDRLLSATSESPLGFESRSFSSLESLNDWVYDFARGKGDAGEELYRRCDGKCSPQYVWIISPEPEELLVDTEVTCGHARDRAIDRYELTSHLRWTCRRP